MSSTWVRSMGAEFASGAGFGAGDLSIVIRSMIAALIMLWGVWTMWKQFQLFGAGRMDVGDWGANVIKMILLIVFVLILVGT